MEALPGWLYWVIVIVAFTLWLIQFLATVRTETHLKKIVDLLNSEAQVRMGAAQALNQIQRNTADKLPEQPKDLLRSGI